MTVVGRGPKGCGAARGHEGRPQLVRAGAGAVNRSRALPKARVTARVRLHEWISIGLEDTTVEYFIRFRFGACVHAMCGFVALGLGRRLPDAAWAHRASQSHVSTLTRHKASLRLGLGLCAARAKG